jgi:hypothetical protein
MSVPRRSNALAPKRAAKGRPVTCTPERAVRGNFE